MFKRLIPIISHPVLDINKEETLFDVDACSFNPSSKGSGSSEQINRSDIPTLRRRHSFVTPYAESIFEEEINKNNGNADMSIDPFDTTNSVKRSKSLSFSIKRMPSFSTLKKKIPKSVHFESSQEVAHEFDPIPIDTENDFKKSEKALLPFEPISQKGSLSMNHPFTSLETYRSQENEIQRKYSSLLDDSLTFVSDMENVDSKSYVVDEVTEKLPYTNDKPPDEPNNISTFEKQKCTLDSENIENCIAKGEKSKEIIKGCPDSKYSDEQLILKMVIHNLVDTEGINLDDLDHNTSLKDLLSISEDIKLSKFQRDSENSLLRNQVKKYEIEMLDKKEKCDSLEEELNSCKMECKKISAKYAPLLKLKNKLEDHEKSLRNNVEKLEVDLATMTSSLQAEHLARSELLVLINKYDNSEELTDTFVALKGYIEELLIKNQSIVKENTLLLEEKVKRKNEVESLNNKLKDNIEQLLDIQETLEALTEENKGLKTTMGELKDGRCNSDKIHNDKINYLTRALDEKNYDMNQITKALSESEIEIQKLNKEKDYLQKELLNNLTDIEEANKQMKDELIYRNKMERSYNELELKIEESKAAMSNSLIEAKDQLGAKIELIAHLEDEKSKLITELSVLQLEKRKVTAEKHNLVEENERLAKINRESKLAFDLLESYIEKSNENVNIMSREYLLVLSSNEIVSSAVRNFTKSCFRSLKPLMYEESGEYAAKLYNKLEDLTLFSKEHESLLHAISNFIPKCISDLVSQYTKTESLLQSEINKRNNNYQKMLDKLTKIMEDNLTGTTNSKENINNTKMPVGNNYKVDKKNSKLGIAYKNPNQ